MEVNMVGVGGGPVVDAPIISAVLGCLSPMIEEPAEYFKGSLVIMVIFIIITSFKIFSRLV